jgi:hypothetical protein
VITPNNNYTKVRFYNKIIKISSILHKNIKYISKTNMLNLTINIKSLKIKNLSACPYCLRKDWGFKIKLLGLYFKKIILIIL